MEEQVGRETILCLCNSFESQPDNFNKVDCRSVEKLEMRLYLVAEPMLISVMIPG